MYSLAIPAVGLGEISVSARCSLGDDGAGEKGDGGGVFDEPAFPSGDGGCVGGGLPFGVGCLKAVKKSENFRKSFKNFKSSSVLFKFPNKGFTLSAKSGFCESAYNNNNAIVSILYYTQM